MTALTEWPQRTVPGARESSRSVRSRPRSISGLLRSSSCGLVVAYQVRAAIVETPLLAFGPGQREELVEQSGCAQGDLAGFFVDVESAALRAGVGAGLMLEGRDRHAVLLQDARTDEAAEAGCRRSRCEGWWWT